MPLKDRAAISIFLTQNLPEGLSTGQNTQHCLLANLLYHCSDVRDTAITVGTTLLYSQFQKKGKRSGSDASNMYAYMQCKSSLAAQKLIRLADQEQVSYPRTSTLPHHISSRIKQLS